MKFNWPLSLIGLIFSFKKDAFSLGFGSIAQFQWLSLDQNFAFLKAGCTKVFCEFHSITPPQ